MTNPLEKATHDAVEAADNAEQLRLIAAVLQAQQLLTAQQQPQQTCQHHHRAPVSPAKWVAIGCAVCVGSIGLALGFLAVAIAAVCSTGCLIVLRSMWREYQKNR